MTVAATALFSAALLIRPDQMSWLTSLQIKNVLFVNVSTQMPIILPAAAVLLGVQDVQPCARVL